MNRDQVTEILKQFPYAVKLMLRQKPDADDFPAADLFKALKDTIDTVMEDGGGKDHGTKPTAYMHVHDPQRGRRRRDEVSQREPPWRLRSPPARPHR